MRGIKRLAGVGLLCLMQAPALSAEELNDRVARLERLLDSQSLVEMLAQMERLQMEIQQLRGEVELQNHQLNELKQRQRDLYLDVDRRLSHVEREGGAGTALVSGSAEAPGGEALVMAGPGAAAGNAAGGESGASYSPEEERKAYQEAFDLLRELRYKQAIKAFRAFLKKYPDGRYGHIAQYWLGEANYAQRNFKQAIDDYHTLLTVYTQSPKLAEAMLKIGYSHYELGDKKAAASTLNELVQSYPDTTEAGQAKSFLKRIKKEGG